MSYEVHLTFYGSTLAVNFRDKGQMSAVGVTYCLLQQCKDMQRRKIWDNNINKDPSR